VALAVIDDGQQIAIAFVGRVGSGARNEHRLARQPRRKRTLENLAGL
jgi:hypothetical protein